MQLWTWRVAQSMVESSKLPMEGLPTPYQLSLLIGICMASRERLRRWTSYRCWRKQRRRAPRSPEVLVRAGLMLYLCLFLASLMFAADTTIHYTTETVVYHQVEETSSFHEFGRALSQQCLSMDRNANFGAPCSLNSLIPVNNYLSQQNEMLSLYHNSSQTSEIRIAAADGSEFAFLLPKIQYVSPFLDYRASTIGISTQCKPITQLCNFGVWGVDGMYSGFFCSPNFWGVLGKTNTNITSDPDVPPLAVKASPNLL